MSVRFPVKIEFSAVDKLTSVVKGINDKIEKATAPMRAVSGAFAPLGQALNLKGLKDSFSRVGSAASAVRSEIQGAAIAAAALVGTVVGGSFALVKGFAEAADNISETAERLGISTSALQEYRYAAKIAGVDQEGFDKGLQKLGQHLAEASVGMGDALPVFQALGINAKDANGKVRSLESVLPELATKFSQIGSESVKNALAVKIFGREGAKMSVLLSQGADGVEKLRREAQDLGAVMDAETTKRAGDFGDTLDRMHFAIGGVRNIIAAQLLPVFESLANEFFDFIKNNRQDFVALGQALKVVLVEVVGGVKVVLGALISVAKTFNAMGMEEKVSLIRKTLALFAAFIMGPVLVSLFNLASALGSLALTGLPFLFKSLLVGGKILLWVAQAFRVLSLLLFTNPFGWIVLGITAAITAGYLLIKNWDSVKAFFTDIWENPGRSLLKFLGFMFPFIGLATLLIENWDVVKQFFVDLWNDPKKALAGFVDAVFAKLGSLWEWIKSQFGDVLGVGGSVGFTGAPAGGETALNAMNATQRNQNETRVMVDFSNLPRGAQVQTSSKNAAPLDLSLGYAGVF